MLALTPAASLAAHTPLPPSAEGGGGSFAERMVEDIRPLRKNTLASLAHAAYADTRKADGASHQLFLYPVASSPPRTSAAALSAAVDSTKLQGTAPNSQAEPTPKNRPNSNASRSSGERGLGGEALLSEKRPLPPASPSPSSLREGARGRGLLYREVPSLASLHHSLQSNGQERS